MSGALQVVFQNLRSFGFGDWILTLTGSTANTMDITADSSGNVYASGATAGSPNTDGFLVKVKSDGTVLAKKTVTGSSYEMLDSAEVDSSGNIFLFGYNIPTGSGQGQALVMKLDSSYNITWQNKFEYAPYANDEDPATGGFDSSGNVYFAYGFYGGSNRRGVAVKLASNGGLQYSKEFYTSNSIDTYVRHAVVDTGGNLYINITNLNNSPFGIRQITTKVSNAGDEVWSRTLYASGEYVSAGEGQSVAVDASGNVYVVGRSNYSASGGYTTGFVAKYNSSGTIQWQRILYSTVKGISLEGVAVDSSGNVYAVGYDDSNSRAAIFKYNSSGSLQWQKQIYYAGASNSARGCIVSGSYIYVAGIISSALTGSNIFKLGTDGTGTGTYGSWTYADNNYTDVAGNLTSASFAYTFNGIEAGSTSTSLSIGNKTLTETLTTF